MKRFTFNYIMIKSLIPIIELGTLAYVELSIDQLTHNYKYIVLSRAIITTVYFLIVMAKVSISNRLYLSRILYLIIIALLTSILLKSYLISYYVLLCIVTVSSILLSSGITSILDKGVKFDNKPKVNRRIELVSSISKVLSVALGASMLYFKFYHYIMLLTMIIVAIFILLLYRSCLKIWTTLNTRDHLILNQHQINAAFNSLYGKRLYKLKDTSGIFTTMVFFFLFVTIESSIWSLITVYIHSQLRLPQEYQFITLVAFLVGVSISSFFKSYIISRVRLSYMLQSSFIFLSVILLVMAQTQEIWYIVPLTFLLGITSDVIVLSTDFSIRQSIKSTKVETYIKVVSLLRYLLLALVNISIVYLSFYHVLDWKLLYLSESAVSVVIIMLITTSRLFKKKSKDMTYTTYR